MGNNKNCPKDAADLRQKAEAAFLSSGSSEDLASLPPEKILTLLHELRVHQIELEMQNEELREAQEELDASRTRYFDLYDLAPVGYITLSEQGLILESNLAAATLLGEPRSNLIKQPVSGFILKEDQDIYYRHRKLLFESGEPQECELRLAKKDGATVWVRITATAAEYDGRTVCRIVIINITEEHKHAEAEREEFQARLNQARKMESIGTLAGGIAHDFNNILFPIIGHTEMLMNDLSEENSSIRNSLDTIYSGALRARDLVKQILAFAHQEKKELKPTKMQPIIKEALKLIRSTIPTTIAIRQHLSSDCGSVSADSTQIHQIVMNLATNAYHAMAENGGELKVNLKEVELGKDGLISPDMHPGVYACLTIADTGAGMNKDVMNQIFDPFFTTKEQGKGTGMGLSVVHGIVKRMNGEIQVYSEQGKGTEFQVYLPVVGNAPEKQVSKADEPMRGGCERLLLVDDEEAVIALERKILERLGYQVASRTGSIEALEAFKAGPDKFDLVITDMSMPKMPGDKLASELINIRPDIPILLCTGYSKSITAEKIKSLGIKGFLMKPIEIKEFAQKIRNVLDGSKNA